MKVGSTLQPTPTHTMSKQEIRIFISSPGDVQAERDALKALVKDELQHTLGDKHGLHLVPVMWEDLGRPGMGDIQENLFKQLGDFNIFIGMFWHRFGTPSGNYESGSEAEFRRAYEKWKADHSFPIFMYFCERNLPANVDTRQLDNVRAFKKEINSKGLTWPYHGVDDLVTQVRKHVTDELYDFLAKQQKPPPRAASPQEPDEHKSVYGELLVYMLNRTSICDQIAQAILDQQRQPEKPIICIIHGDSDQCIGEFVERLQLEDLPKWWELDKKKEKVHEIRFLWPRAWDTLEAFHGQLTRALSMVVEPTFKSGADVKGYLEGIRTPVLISSQILASDWERYGEAQVLEAFMDYWRELCPLRRRVVVLLSVKYTTSTRSWFNWMQRAKSAYRHVEEALHLLSPPPCQSIILNVPERLPNVTPTDVEGWAWVYCKKEMKPNHMDTLFLNKKEKEQGVAMEVIVERLQPILPLLMLDS